MVTPPARAPRVLARRRAAVTSAVLASLLLAGATVAVAEPAIVVPEPGGESWAAELALEGGDDTGVLLADGAVRPLPTPGVRPEGILTVAPRRLLRPTRELAGTVTADRPPGTEVDLEARGLDPDGRWGPWQAVRDRAPAQFAAPTSEVQVRLVLRGTADGSAVPAARGAWLTASSTSPGTTSTTSPSSSTTSSTATSTRPHHPDRPDHPSRPTTTGPTTTTPTTTTPPPSTTTPTTTTTPPTTTTEPTTTTTGPTTTTTGPTTTTTGPTTTTTTTTSRPSDPSCLPVPSGLPVPLPTVCVRPPTIPTDRPQALRAADATTTSTTPTTSSTASTTGLIWDGAIATKGLGGFKDTPWNITDDSTVTVVDGPAKTIRFTVPAGSQRAEVEPDVDEFGEGQTRFFRLTYTLPPSFPLDPGGFQLATQWKNDGTGSPPLELRIEDGKFRLGGGFGRPGGSRLFSTDIAPAVTGRPVDIVVGIVFSSDPEKGRVDVWLDGQQRVAGFRPPGGTLYEGKQDYWKVGLYRDTSNQGTATADLGVARVGETYGSVAGTPTPAPAPAPPSTTTSPSPTPSTTSTPSSPTSPSRTVVATAPPGP
ncbi:heparin lyase I family protein [Actinomycetospora termitidis]|uniref:Heparin lyase I family protein n=1 Tax=Actinomycetospora termitidis TaxID=3053470 RepID=A0ABT7MA45_9PSEU|nr:heparin lyase I family protein [Actinomycetospora sp. Odt1-22]MDL5157488.1 heparin lyase I family protein [Actinomycetospora sp. Odt1-22]